MVYDPTDVRAQERAHADEETSARLAREQEVEDFKWLMGDPRGRRVMWCLLGLTGVYRSEVSSEDLARHAGARNVGIWALDQMHEHCLNEYVQMFQENRP